MEVLPPYCNRPGFGSTGKYFGEVSMVAKSAKADVSFMTRERLCVCAVALALCMSAHAQNYTFTTLNDRSNGGNVTAINDAGQVVGNNDFGGFVYSNGTFHLSECPRWALCSHVMKTG